MHFQQRHDSMDMDMSGMDMGGMDMGGMDMGGSTVPGVPSLSYLQQMYWAVVGTFIAMAALVNLANYAIFRQRLSAASRGHAKPAKPRSLIFRVNATATAIVREAANASFAPFQLKGRSVRLPTLGTTAIIAANVVTLLVLCFFKFDLKDQWSFEDIGYRTGCISVAQLPLIFLLAGKNNIIGWLTGTSYERLNCLHRWAARCLLLTVTIHMGYWFADWAPYGYIGKKIKTDDITQHGIISWALLLWIVISSVSPIRGWKYEFFVIQHLGSMAVFLAFVYMHISSWPMYIRIYVWIPIALVCFDRVCRGVWVLYTNISIFHPDQRKEGNMSSFWACKAEFTPLAHDTTRITIRNPPISWRPGQHAFLSCHSVVPLQSHPFTIASIPEDGKMEFYVKSEKGATKRFFRHAEKLQLLPAPSPDDQTKVSSRSMKPVAIDGPYGRIRPLRQFDSVVLLAGSTGATFTVPLLRDIVAHWQHQHRNERRASSKLPLSAPAGAVTRHVRFVWVVKSRGCVSWFAEQLSRVMEDVVALRTAGASVEVEMSVYVTCDPAFTDERKTLLSNNPAPGRGGAAIVEEACAPAVSDEKAQLKKQQQEQGDKIEVREIRDSYASSLSSSADSNHNKRKDETTTAAGGACGPDGTCCCTTTIEDEDDAIAPAACTCCNKAKPSTSKTTRATAAKSPTASSTTDASSSSSLFSNQPLNSGIALLGGRPHPRTIIRKTLEQARGESGVVVCGPAALAADVRQAVVRLSDERAVHKGTGAQGIYLHAEAFGF